MSEKSSKGLAVALLVVGLVAGLAVGYFLQVPEVNRLNTELSASEDYRRELESIRADLESQVASLLSSASLQARTITELQDSLQIAESDLDEAEDKIENQVTEIHGLLSERNRLKATVSDLEAVDLDGLAVLSWIGSQFTFEGMVTNHGTESAYGVHVVLELCQDDQIVFQQERWVADFAGREMESFEFSFTFSGAWDDWGWWIETDGLIFFIQ